MKNMNFKAFSLVLVISISNNCIFSQEMKPRYQDSFSQMEDPQQLLGEAISNFNVQGVRTALKMGANINAPVKTFVWEQPSRFTSWPKPKLSTNYAIQPILFALINLEETLSDFKGRAFDKLHNIAKWGVIIGSASFVKSCIENRIGQVKLAKLSGYKIPSIDRFIMQTLFWIMTSVATLLSAQKTWEKGFSREKLAKLHNALEIVKIIYSQPGLKIDERSAKFLENMKKEEIFSSYMTQK